MNFHQMIFVCDEKHPFLPIVSLSPKVSQNRKRKRKNFPLKMSLEEFSTESVFWKTFINENIYI